MSTKLSFNWIYSIIHDPRIKTKNGIRIQKKDRLRTGTCPSSRRRPCCPWNPAGWVGWGQASPGSCPQSPGPGRSSRWSAGRVINQATTHLQSSNAPHSIDGRTNFSDGMWAAINHCTSASHYFIMIIFYNVFVPCNGKKLIINQSSIKIVFTIFQHFSHTMFSFI